MPAAQVLHQQPTANGAGGSSPSPPRHLWKWKLGFRLASTIFSLVIIGLAASVLPLDQLALIIFAGPPAAVALLWNIAEGICLALRGRHRGIHPGAIVGVDLILWLGFAAVTILVGILLHTFLFPDRFYSTYELDPSPFTKSLKATKASIVLCVLETILHVVLFSIGCYETSLRNQRPHVVYLTPAPEAAATQTPPKNIYRGDSSDQKSPPYTPRTPVPAHDLKRDEAVV